MTGQEAAKEYRLREWAELISARVRSGKTVNDWCAEHSMSRHMYYYRLRNVRKYAAQELAPVGWAAVETKPAPGTLEKTKSSEALILAPHCEKEVVGVGTLRIEIGKCSVIADQETDPELLLKVCRVLAELC